MQAQWLQRIGLLVVAASAFVQNEEGAVLLLQRSDNGLWSLPGGGMEFGEFVAQTAERETLDYRIKVSGMVGVYSDPNHVIAYDNAEVRQQFNLCFRAELLGGELRTSAESPRVRWGTGDELGGLPVHPSTALRIRNGLAGGPAPYIG